MERPSLDRLFAVETNLNRSFVAAVASLGLLIVTMLVLARSGGAETAGGLVLAGLLLILMGAYIWYAIAAGAAAKALGEKGWPYVVWTLAAPILSMLPIPIVSTLITASPLAIKFLLGGQLATVIRERSLEG